MKYTEKQIITAIKGTGGIMNQILYNLEKLSKVDKLDYTRQALHKRIFESETLKQVYLAEKENIDDLAESAFAKAIQDKEPWAIRDWLKYRGRIRGYEQSSNIKVSDAEPPIALVEIIRNADDNKKENNQSKIT